MRKLPSRLALFCVPLLLAACVKSRRSQEPPAPKDSNVYHLTDYGVELRMPSADWQPKAKTGYRLSGGTFTFEHASLPMTIGIDVGAPDRPMSELVEGLAAGIEREGMRVLEASHDGRHGLVRAVKADADIGPVVLNCILAPLAGSAHPHVMTVHGLAPKAYEDDLMDAIVAIIQSTLPLRH